MTTKRGSRCGQHFASLWLLGLLACSGDGDENAGLAEPSAPDTSEMSADAMSAAGQGAQAPATDSGSGVGSDPAMDPNGASDPVVMMEPSEPAEPGLHWKDDALVFRTEDFNVPAGEEQYLCWTLTSEEAVKVDAFEFAGATVVHHFIFAQTILPEPEGFSVCEGLLKTTWLPLFTAGAGANELRFPSGIAQELAAGTQLLVQLHLLNASAEDVEDAVEIIMHVTEEPDTQPVHIGGFGSYSIELPPGQETSVSHECTLPSTSRLVALMPHMHQLATSMTLELGSGPNDLEVFYARDPWNFDQQTIDVIDTTIQGGQYARVTCNYNNTTDQTVRYGESSLDEMCFLGAFWAGPAMNCVAFF